jgi:hypothetical protein
MDSYFRNHPWIVPGANVEAVDGRTREKELADSKSHATGFAATYADPSDAVEKDAGEKPRENRLESV